MTYSDSELRLKIGAAVAFAFEKNPVSMQDIIDLLFVQLKPLVKTEQRAYTVAQLRELLTSLS
jgi:hypothetical protein